MDIVLKIMIVGLSIFEVYLCYQFLFLCWADKKELSRESKIVLAVVCIVVGGMVGINRSLFLFSHWMLVTELIIVSLSLFAIPMEKKLIAVELVGTYFVLTALMDFLFVFVFLDILGENNAKVIFFGDSLYKIAIFICTRILIFQLFYKAHGREGTLKQTIYEYRKELFLFFMSSVVILRVYQIIFSEYLGSRSSWKTKGAVTSLVAILILSILGIGMLLKNFEAKKELDFSLYKDNIQNKYYQQMLELMQESREHIHDMKHHLQLLDNYAKKGKNQKIHEYLEDIGMPLLSLEKIAWTDSPILNLVLNQKKADAEKKKIEVSIDAQRGCHIVLSDYEICSLFSNLLDNAMEACTKVMVENRWIEIQLGNQGEMSFIYVANSANKSPRIIDGKLRSDKDQKGLHGLGLCSVERIVKKYDGSLEIRAKEDEFIVYITFFE